MVDQAVEDINHWVQVQLGKKRKALELVEEDVKNREAQLAELDRQISGRRVKMVKLDTKLNNLLYVEETLAKVCKTTKLLDSKLEALACDVNINEERVDECWQDNETMEARVEDMEQKLEVLEEEIEGLRNMMTVTQNTCLSLELPIATTLANLNKCRQLTTNCKKNLMVLYSVSSRCLSHLTFTEPNKNKHTCRELIFLYPLVCSTYL